MAQINRNKKHNLHRVKMRVTDMGFSVSNDNKRIIAMIEEHEKRRFRFCNTIFILYCGILLLALIMVILD